MTPRPKQALDGPRAAPALHRLLPHCTGRTAATAAMRDAGTCGHEAEHRDTSGRICGLNWGRHVAAPDGAVRLLATGYSCRSPAKRLDGVALPHPAQALSRALRRAAETAHSASRPAARTPRGQAGAGPAGTGAPSPQAGPVAG